MKALIHLDQNGKKVMERRVHEAVMKERADISTRAQYVWALSMLQCGLSPRTVQRVVNHFDAVVDKYIEDLGDLFMRSMLHDSGVEVKATSRERKRKRR